MPSPQTSITIFSNGIANFSKVIWTTGQPQAIELPVNKAYIADVLASLIIHGPVELTVPPNFMPETEGKLVLSPENVFKDIFTNLRGAEVEIEMVSGNSKSGRIWGLDYEEVATGGEAVNRYFGQLLTHNGVVSVARSDVNRINFLQESVRSEVDKALNRAFQKIRPQSSTVDMEVCGNQKGLPFYVNYAIPAAAWKMTYRLSKYEDKFQFNGIAVVDNNTEEDWNDCSIRLVVGEPITFATDIAECKIPNRSTVNLVSNRTQSAVEAPSPVKSMMRSASFRQESVASFGFADSSSSPAMEAKTEHNEVGDFTVFNFGSDYTIKAGTSAEIPAFNAELDAKSVLYYNRNDHETRPFRAIKFKNETEYNLGRGVCTVYEKGIFSGTAVLNATKRNEESLLCHAVETGVRVHFECGNPKDRISAFRIKRGVGVTVSSVMSLSEYVIKNVKDETFSVVLDHNATLRVGQSNVSAKLNGDPIQPSDQIKDGWRYEFALGPNETVVLTIDEHTSMEQTVSAGEWLIRSQDAKSLLNKPEIKRIMGLQHAVNVTEQAVLDLEEKLERLNQDHSRALDMIKSDPHGDWRKMLIDAEKDIQDTGRNKLPTARENLRTAQDALKDYLNSLAEEWMVNE